MIVLAVVAAWMAWQPWGANRIEQDALAALSARRHRRRRRSSPARPPTAIRSRSTPCSPSPRSATAAGDQAGARRAYTDAVELQPRNPRPWLSLAQFELVGRRREGRRAGGPARAVPRPEVPGGRRAVRAGHGRRDADHLRARGDGGARPVVRPRRHVPGRVAAALATGVAGALAVAAAVALAGGPPTATAPRAAWQELRPRDGRADRGRRGARRGVRLRRRWLRPAVGRLHRHRGALRPAPGPLAPRAPAAARAEPRRHGQ